MAYWRSIGFAAGVILLAASPIFGSSALADEPDAIFLMLRESTLDAPAERPMALSYEALGKGDYDAALRHLQIADAVPVHEGPRYLLLPQLAYLSWINGDRVAARRYARMAAASASIMAGKATCPDDSVDAPPTATLSGLTEPLSTAEESEVRARMCSAFLAGMVGKGPTASDRLYLAKLKALEPRLEGP